MPSTAYPPLRPVEPRPPILPAPAPASDSADYRLPPTSSTGGTPSAEAGPSNAGAGNGSPAGARQRRAPAPGINVTKKRRSAVLEDGSSLYEGGADVDTDSPLSTTVPAPPKQREGPKKKKAARACSLCQKAHLTCDDARPCQRCVKRGMADKCTEGHRKKAKYLLEENEIVEALKKGKSDDQRQQPQSSQEPTPQPQIAPQPSPLAVDTFPPSDIYFGLQQSLVPDQSYTFGSEAANLEYSSLSAILGLNSYSPDQPFLTSETPPSSAPAAFGTQFANSGWPAEPNQQQQRQQQSIPQNIAPQALMGEQSSGFDTGGYTSAPGGNTGPYAPGPEQFGESIYDNGASNIAVGQNGRDIQQQTIPIQRLASDSGFSVPELGFPNQQAYAQQIAMQQPQRLNSIQSISAPSSMVLTSSVAGATPPSTDSPMSSTPLNESSPATISSGQDFYSSINKPYSYVESYTFLMKYLNTNNFGKNDILRVIRALAVYRPSMIALQMPLTEEDYIFMERCLRRSLVELEKLITYTGTPTVVWRRTGEICAVGEEFCLLTEWKRETLLTGSKHIYELFELQSVIEYWEKFASHAFENTTQSVSTHCVLLKPSGEPIPCTFCFSIRRDLFDMPSLVIGQWLPLM